jgi:hypothetical protein
MGHFLVVIPPASTKADIASTLCAARLRVGLLGDIVKREIIALDCGMPEQQRQLCAALCREFDHVSLLTPTEFLDKIDKLSSE